jgi:hypothetical protein
MHNDKVLVLDVGTFSTMEIEGKIRKVRGDDIMSKNKHKKKRIKSYEQQAKRLYELKEQVEI